MPSKMLQIVLQKLMEQVLTHILHQVTLMSIPWCLAKDCRRWIPANIGNNAISGGKRWRIPTIDRKRFNRGFSHPIPLSDRRSYEVYERQPSLLASETSVRIPLRTVSLQSLRKICFCLCFYPAPHTFGGDTRNYRFNFTSPVQSYRLPTNTWFSNG